MPPRRLRGIKPDYTPIKLPQRTGPQESYLGEGCFSPILSVPILHFLPPFLRVENHICSHHRRFKYTENAFTTGRSVIFSLLMNEL